MAEGMDLTSNLLWVPTGVHTLMGVQVGRTAFDMQYGSTYLVS